MSLYADNGLQALEVLNELHRIFDVARLVDPENNHVLTLDGASRLTETDECCYHFWGCGDCCENCTSRHALDDKSRTGKLEVRDGALFCVVSHYQRFNGRDCVLEIAVRMDDERAPESGAGQGLMHFYRDALTQAYSRLYLNSFRANLEHTDGVALIMVTDIAEWLAVWLGTGPVEWHTLRTADKFAELTFTPSCVPFVCMRAISGAKTGAWTGGGHFFMDGDRTGRGPRQYPLCGKPPGQVRCTAPGGYDGCH